MGINRLKASNDPARATHPDIDPATGDLRPEALVYSDPAERDFNSRFANDQGFAANLMERVISVQKDEAEWIQRQIQGRAFGEGRGPHAGLVEYQQELARLRADEDMYQYGADATVVRDHEVADMDLQTYDRHFDERGQPRPGVVLEHTSRSVRLDDGIDRHSAGELRSNQR